MQSQGASIHARKLTKHDQYIEHLHGIIAKDYDYVLKNVPLYSKRRRLVGEADLIGVKDGVYDIYEVKCSYRITKARKQLHKLRRLLWSNNVRSTFFFCGTSGTLMVI